MTDRDLNDADSDRIARVAVPLAGGSAPTDGETLTAAERARLESFIDANLDTGRADVHSLAVRSRWFVALAATAAAIVVALLGGFVAQSPSAPLVNAPDVADDRPVLPTMLTWEQVRERFNDFDSTGNLDAAFVRHHVDQLALSDYAEAAARSADHLTSQDHYRRGLVLAEAGDHRRAISEFTSALHGDPGAVDVQASATLARIDSYIAIEPLTAVRELTGLLTDAGTGAPFAEGSVRLRRARAQFALGNRQLALADLDRLIGDSRAEHDHPLLRQTYGSKEQPLNLRGLILLDLGRANDAVDDFTAALAISPDNLDYLRNRARARMVSGDAKAARADLDRVHSLIAMGGHGAIERALPDFDVDVDGKKHPATYGAYVPTAAATIDADSTAKLPCIVYLHGGGGDAFNKQGTASIRAWTPVCEAKGYFCICPNALRRGWQRPSVDHSMKMIVAAIKDLATEHPVDVSRIILAGGSAGSDFSYTSGIQLQMKEAGITCIGCLPIVPGPPNMVGVNKGELARVAAFPFLHVCGRKDTIRKEGAWQAHCYLLEHGGDAAISGFVEMPDRAHEFPSTAELTRCIEWFESLATINDPKTWLPRATAAKERGDVLSESTWLHKVLNAEVTVDFVSAAERKGAQDRFGELAKQAATAWKQASEIDAEADAPQAIEATWQCMVRYRNFPEGARAAARFAELKSISGIIRTWSRWIAGNRWDPRQPD